MTKHRRWQGFLQGGETMIEETIRAVKKAEAEAEQILADANSRAEQLIRDAQTEAAGSESRSREAAQEERKKRLSEARSAANAYLDSQTQQASEEANGIRIAASAREEEAIDAVIGLLLS